MEEEKIIELLNAIDNISMVQWEKIKFIVDQKFKSISKFKVPNEELETLKNYLKFELKWWGRYIVHLTIMIK